MPGGRRMRTAGRRRQRAGLSGPGAAPGFARAEMLVLGGCLVVLFSMLWPVYAALASRSCLARVRSDFHVIVKAADRYFNEYRRWPSAHMGGHADTRYGEERPNAEVMNVLSAVEGPGNEGHLLNPHRIDFLGVALEEERRRNGDVAGCDASGEYRDPWGSPYQIVLDTNSDTDILVGDSHYGWQREQDLLVWSCGRDRTSDTRDDLLAWRRAEEGGGTGVR